MPRLADTLREVLSTYPSARTTQKFGTSAPFWSTLRDLQTVAKTLPLLTEFPRLRGSVSFGKGGWAHVPMVAYLDEKETTRPAAGVYVVLLVRADCSGVVLSLNQGSADLYFEKKDRALGILRRRAASLRRHLNPTILAAGFDDCPIELASSGPLAVAYQAGSVVAKSYSAEELHEERLLGDLRALFGAYTAVVPTGRLKLDSIAT